MTLKIFEVMCSSRCYNIIYL